MSIVTAFFIIFIIAITIARGIINAKIFNNLHNTETEMFVSAKDTSRQEIDKSSESLLFAIYCSLVFVWFQFKKEDTKYVIYNYLLSLITGALIYGYIIYLKWQIKSYLVASNKDRT